MAKNIDEDSNEQKKDYLKRLILDMVKGAGMLSVSLVAPNVLTSMHRLGIIANPRQKEYIASSASRLVRKGLLKFNGKYYELTISGQKQLKKWELAEYRIKRPKKWDGKWRMIIFDIPEKQKKIRRQITDIFIQAGLQRLQDSVWVFPYDCGEIIGLLKAELGVGKDVLYVIADEIENDRHLRYEFDLV